jgi:ketosteroid isomerase-like protein
VIVERLLGAAKSPDATQSSSAASVAREFVAKINAHDVEALGELLSHDHEFVDSLGATTTGREALKHGWAGYFRCVPDYAIEVTDEFLRGDVVALFGFAGGTCAPDGKPALENRWRIPAAWHVTVESGLVARWQVFADNKPMHELLARSRE